MVLKMKMIAINKLSGKLKNWSVEMPNAPYSNRWQHIKKSSNIDKFVRSSLGFYKQMY